jgi:group I intron endonuclease
MGCIYRIYNKINGKSYIGQSKNDTPIVRWNRHVRDAEKGSPNAIHKAIIKYGIDAFEVSVLCICETQEERNKREDELITEYKSMQEENGYNMVRGGKGRAPNFNHKEEHKNKMSILMTGRKLTPETKEKLSKAKAGKPASEKAKNSITLVAQTRFNEDIFPKRLADWITIYNKNGCQPKSNSEDPDEKFVADWRQTIIKKKNNDTNKRTKTGLTEDQIRILNETPGWTWAAPDPFPEQFENFKLQYEKYEGNMTKDGKDKDKDRAINWVRAVRQKKRNNDPKLTQEQIELLDSCEIWSWTQTTFLTFDDHVKNWVEIYKKLKHPPKTSSDVFEERKSANWQHQMRTDYRDKKPRITQYRINTLNSLEGWVW